jgi:hypothetical protein
LFVLYEGAVPAVSQPKVVADVIQTAAAAVDRLAAAAGG